jgi:N-acetylneuraminic acid mutarotase
MQRLSGSILAIMLASTAMQAADVCLPPLPEAHANNAVAALVLDGKNYIMSFAGLKRGKTWKDTSKSAYMLRLGQKGWEKLPDIPVADGRLAASAEGVNGKVYLFGGYTVAEDGSEVSTPEVFAFDPIQKTYTRVADMPTPVDDMVTFVYQSRYIYLVSGWHNDGNVSLVQIYDTHLDAWQRGTDYPGTPVFGHAGGIVGNQFVIADGVAVVGKDENGRRIFDTVNEGWMGTIDPNDPSKISYKKLPQLPGRGHYRMAAAGDAYREQVIFMGGTPTAYNYNGIGYSGKPAEASEHMYAWSFAKDNWLLLEDRPVRSMDHRGMVKVDDVWWTVGGLNKDREVTGAVLAEKLLVCSKPKID